MQATNTNSQTTMTVNLSTFSFKGTRQEANLLVKKLIADINTHLREGDAEGLSATLDDFAILQARIHAKASL